MHSRIHIIPRLSLKERAYTGVKSAAEQLICPFWSVSENWILHHQWGDRAKTSSTEGTPCVHHVYTMCTPWHKTLISWTEASLPSPALSGSEHWGLQAWSWQTTRRSPLSASVFCPVGFLLPCRLVKGLPSTRPPRFQLPTVLGLWTLSWGL